MSVAIEANKASGFTGRYWKYKFYKIKGLGGDYKTS